MTDSQSRMPNPDQQAVIQELDRNLILFASAGTGKTFTVAKRVQRILESGRARPEEILCLTFTIKAAGDFGFYLVELSNESLKSTLRYIVK